jgi:drug/metabolite transporter, DME family
LFSALSQRTQGYLFAIAAPVSWSVGGLVMRLVDAGPWEIVFWRALPHALIFAFVLRAMTGHWGITILRDHTRLVLISAVCVCVTLTMHVIGMTSTTVANALLLQSTSPIMVAFLALFFLKEKVPAASWAAIAIAMGGLGLVMGASLSEGALLGKFAALSVALGSAINVTLIRGKRALDLRVGTVLAAIMAVALSWAIGNPFAVPAQSAIALFVLGFVQMSLGLSFFYAAIRRLPVVQVVLIALLEPVLGPVWTWLGVGETPSLGTIVGGAILLAALAGNAIVTGRSGAK